MKYLLFILFLKGSLLTYGQNEISILLTQSDWKLVNENSYPYSGNGLPIYDFEVSKDSVLSLTYCYIKFDYKITSIDSDSLVLNHIQEHKFGKDLVFIKTNCTKEDNQFNNTKYLSFKYRDYEIIINDSLGIQASILDEQFKEITLTKKSQFELNDFILNNRHNDTHMDFIVIETSSGRFSVVSDSEKVCVRIVYKSITIEYNNLEIRSGKKYSIPIVCTNFHGTSYTRLYYF